MSWTSYAIADHVRRGYLCFSLHWYINFVASFIFTYTSSAFDGFLALFGVRPVAACTCLWLQDRMIGCIRSAHCIFCMIQLSRILLNVNIILWANIEWDLVATSVICFSLTCFWKANPLFLSLFFHMHELLEAACPSCSCFLWTLEPTRSRCLTL